MPRTVHPSYITTKTIHGIKLKFEWWGGEYIEVSEYGRAPVEVINVWDYEAGKATIPFTQKALKAKVAEWIFEYGQKDLVHDVEENWYG